MQRVFVDGGIKEIKRRLVVDSASVSRIIKRASLVDPDGNLKIYATYVQPILLSISPPNFYVPEVGTSTKFIQTDLAVATVSGGLGPFSYSWIKISGNNITIGSPSNASTRFGANVPLDTLLTAEYRCSVTDALGNAASANIIVTLENVGIS